MLHTLHRCLSDLLTAAYLIFTAAPVPVAAAPVAAAPAAAAPEAAAPVAAAPKKKPGATVVNFGKWLMDGETVVLGNTPGVFHEKPRKPKEAAAGVQPKEKTPATTTTAR